MAARRWKCPRCDVGRNAPGRMAPDDVRRYCLPCSQETGKLVPMVCPALERRRTQKTRARQRKATQARQREVQRTYFNVEGDDMRAVLRKVKALNVWKREGPRVHRAVGKLELAADAAYRAWSTEDFVLFLIRAAARKAVGVMGLNYVGSPLAGLERAALCEYFGLDEREVSATLRMTQKLTPKPQRNGITFAHAVLQHVRAAKRDKLGD